MKILVTGGAGYIGSVLVPHLLAAGHEVEVIDNFLYGQTPLLDCCHHAGLSVIRGDARDESLLARSVRRAEAIIPLACLTGAPACARDPIGARTVNLEAIGLLLKLRSRSQPVLFPTTNSGYGRGEPGVFCTEDTPLRPVSEYGRQKVEAEKMILDAGESVTLRLATAFGVSPRMRIDLLVNDFTYRAVTDRFIVLFEPHFKRNFIHVRDVAHAFLHGLERFDRMKGTPYNVGLSDANLSKWELCVEIRRQVPDFVFLEAAVGEDPDKRDYVVSNAKIESTGFRPQVSLGAGISELVKGYAIVRKSGHSNV